MLKGLGQIGDMAKMLKQAQQMQADMAGVQDKIAETLVEGESGAGMVKATANGKGELKSLSIDPSLFSPDDREVVEDLIVAAIKDAQVKASEAAAAEMAKMTEGLNLPAGMKLPF